MFQNTIQLVPAVIVTIKPDERAEQADRLHSGLSKSLRLTRALH